MPFPTWKDLFDEAVLEQHPDKIPRRGQQACEAIHQYRLEKGKSLSLEEREEIEGALKALLVLLQRRGSK